MVACIVDTPGRRGKRKVGIRQDLAAIPLDWPLFHFNFML